MKLGPLLFLAAVNAAPHYEFSRLSGTFDWQVVRPTAGQDHDLGGGGNTSTLEVNAAEEIHWASTPGMYHPGPLSAYMAQVPVGQTAASFDGSGVVWFKVHQESPTYREKPDVFRTRMVWKSQWKETANFTIPSCLENGDYLFRIEHLGLHEASEIGRAQFFISCAQLSVRGGKDTKKLSEHGSFPGVYKATDPGILFDYASKNQSSNIPPEPSVIEC